MSCIGGPLTAVLVLAKTDVAVGTHGPRSVEERAPPHIVEVQRPACQGTLWRSSGSAACVESPRCSGDPPWSAALAPPRQLDHYLRYSVDPFGGKSSPWLRGIGRPEETKTPPHVIVDPVLHGLRGGIRTLRRAGRRRSPLVSPTTSLPPMTLTKLRAAKIYSPRVRQRGLADGTEFGTRGSVPHRWVVVEHALRPAVPFVMEGGRTYLYMPVALQTAMLNTLIPPRDTCEGHNQSHKDIRVAQATGGGHPWSSAVHGLGRLCSRRLCSSRASPKASLHRQVGVGTCRAVARERAIYQDYWRWALPSMAFFMSRVGRPRV